MPADQALLLEHLQRSASEAQCRLEVRASSMHVAGLWESTTHWLHTTRIDLPADALMKTFDADARRCIRKAHEVGFRTEVRHDLDALAAFYRLHTLTRRRLGVPVQPWRYFVMLQRHLLAKGLGFVALTRLGAEPVAAGVFCSFNGSTCYKYGASDEARGARQLRNAVGRDAACAAAGFDIVRLRQDIDGQPGTAVLQAEVGLRGDASRLFALPTAPE